MGFRESGAGNIVVFIDVSYISAPLCPWKDLEPRKAFGRAAMTFLGVSFVRPLTGTSPTSFRVPWLNERDSILQKSAVLSNFPEEGPCKQGPNRIGLAKIMWRKVSWERLLFSRNSISDEFLFWDTFWWITLVLKSIPGWMRSLFS